MKITPEAKVRAQKLAATAALFARLHKWRAQASKAKKASEPNKVVKKTKSRIESIFRFSEVAKRNGSVEMYLAKRRKASLRSSKNPQLVGGLP